MNDFLFHLLLLIAGTFIAAAAQLFLKKAAVRSYPGLFRQYWNSRALSGYFLLFLSTLASLFALRVVPLSLTPVAEASGQVFMALLSFLILKEKITAKKAAGIAVIIAGILIAAL